MTRYQKPPIDLTEYADGSSSCGEYIRSETGSIASPPKSIWYAFDAKASRGIGRYRDTNDPTAHIPAASTTRSSASTLVSPPGLVSTAIPANPSTTLSAAT